MVAIQPCPHYNAQGTMPAAAARVGFTLRPALCYLVSMKVAQSLKMNDADTFHLIMEAE